jgi:hypothetical protein
MKQLGHTFQGKKCARCRQAIESDPAFADDLWYHRTCLEEGIRALQHAQALAARYICTRASSRKEPIDVGPDNRYYLGR